jgi:hypothetical protein
VIDKPKEFEAAKTEENEEGNIPVWQEGPVDEKGEGRPVSQLRRTHESDKEDNDEDLLKKMIVGFESLVPMVTKSNVATKNRKEPFLSGRPSGVA